MGGLKELDLSGNLIEIVPDDLGSLSGLNKLFLNNNRITNLGSSLG